MEENSGERGRLPRLHLDELLEELQVSIDAVRTTRDRVYSLFEAVLSVGSELDLPQALRRIVEAATVLVDAEYGALGVVADDGTLAQFVPVGMTQEQIEAVGPLPTGHGLLGELIRHPEPLRLAEIARHPSSSGFPPRHPPMRTFLGVPVKVRNEVFGNLYLTEKRNGRDFDDEDEALLATLAVAAGVAIDNARLYEQARSRQHWLEANAEITESLLSGMEEPAVLELIVTHARRILRADMGALAIPEGDSGTLRVRLASGAKADRHSGLVLPRRGTFVGAAADAGKPITSSDIAHDPRITAGPPRWQGLGPAVATPMVTEDGVRGVLLLARTDPLAVFTEVETAPLLAYAGQAALAMEVAQRRRDAEQIALLEDRDRIARDLHDLAVQRLFATGISVQSALRFVDHPEARERLLRAVDDLDETTRIIRSTIFGLRRHSEEATHRSLRVRLVGVIEDVVAALGFTPAVRMDGLIDTDVPPAVAEALEAVLGEALSNVARHACATSADVSLTVAGGEARLVVLDDGIGYSEESPRYSGLRNLEERSEKLGGRFVVRKGEAGGTRLEWCAPVT
ncbi:hypothetical protein N566_00335 [Streptomycetaceae bacterium MP113-05]|nr:hypothetical protein N566_00335 [Streptomycetaceae bacterium MP113-05]